LNFSAKSSRAGSTAGDMGVGCVETPARAGLAVDQQAVGRRNAIRQTCSSR